MNGQLVASFFKNQEEQAGLARLEQLKRLGRDFIHVRYIGRSQMPRFHGLQGVEAYESFDNEKNRKVWLTREGSTVLDFTVSSTGDMIADVWDTEYNRFWLSRQLGTNIEIDNAAVRKQIASLSDLPFKVELSRKEELVKQRQRIEEELSRMDLEIESEINSAPVAEDDSTPEFEVIAQQVERDLVSQTQEQQSEQVAPRKRGRPRGKRRAASDRLNSKGEPAPTGSA